MSVNRLWPSEIVLHEDADTGATVRQLTGYRAHSHHFYFTNPGWHDGGKRLLVSSSPPIATTPPTSTASTWVPLKAAFCIEWKRDGTSR